MNTATAVNHAAAASGKLLADLRHRAAWLRQPGLSQMKLGGVMEDIAAEFDRAIAELARPLEAAAPGEDPAETLALVCDALSIGAKARSRATILMNVENARRRSDCLWRIEHEFFMVSEPDEDEPDGEPFETCLLTWSDEPDQYASKFGEVLASRISASVRAAPVTDAEVEAAMRIPRGTKTDTALTRCMLEQFAGSRGLVALLVQPVTDDEIGAAWDADKAAMQHDPRAPREAFWAGALFVLSQAGRKLVPENMADGKQVLVAEPLMTAEQHETKLARVVALIASNPIPDSADGLELQQLAGEVERYENRVFPIAPVSLTRRSLSKRATELHEKAFMPLSEACELALSECGLTAAALQAVIDDYTGVDHDGVQLMNVDDLQAFARHILVWSPLESDMAVGLRGSTDALAPFQARVQPWMMACFGPIISTDVKERNHRFFEESAELVQACGMTDSEAHQLVDYVFGRPVGEKVQEAGGVMVTIAALCLAQNIDMHEAGEIELRRIWTCVEKIRAKQAAKPANSPLPIAAPSCMAVGASGAGGETPGCGM